MKTVFLTLLPIWSLVCVLTQGAAANDEENASAKQKASPHSGQLVIVDFRMGMDLSGWKVEDDVIMGGGPKGHSPSTTMDMPYSPVMYLWTTTGAFLPSSTTSIPSMYHDTAQPT